MTLRATALLLGSMLSLTSQLPGQSGAAQQSTASTPVPNPAAAPEHDAILAIVTRIQRADYEGDRPALDRLYGELNPFVETQALASRVRYWRGFAKWRKALNAFNDSNDTAEIERDLKQAISEFEEATAKDPQFVDAKIGAASCLGNLIFLNQSNPDRVQELVGQVVPLLKDAQAAAPENPRVLWVLGPFRWVAPRERGGGHDKAIETYEKGLEAVRAGKGAASDPLDPSWGEPELLMNLAWSQLNRTAPDLRTAEQYAQDALKLVPYWHYVRDILLPQIRTAQAKAQGALQK